MQLPATTAIDLAVHLHVAVEDDLLGVAAGIEETGELEELSEADHLPADGHIVDRIGVRHP